jgi:hypothetical protein
VTDLYEKFTRGAWLAVPLLLAAAIAGALAIEYDVHQRLAQLRGPITDLGRTVVIAGGAATDLEKTLKQERDAASSQISIGAQAAQQLAAAGANATKLLADTDRSLNDAKAGVLPGLAGAIAEQNANMTALTHRADDAIDTLNATLRQIQPVLEAAAVAAQNGANLSGDPNLKASLAKLDDAMDKVNAALASSDLILASGNRDADMIEARLRQALKPASLAKELFERILQIGPPIATAVRTP